MNRDTAIHFRDEFRDARARALRDSEGFGVLLFALERLGRFLRGGRGNLGKFEPVLVDLASKSPLAKTIPERHRGFHTPFGVLFRQLKSARNAALHEGAFARHLTADAVNVAIVLEDALLMDFDRVGDYMVRSVLCAAPWQPLSFVRQMLLANSFSYLPVNMGSETEPDWQLLSDFAVAACLRIAEFREREALLATSVREAVESRRLALLTPLVCGPDTSIADALAKSNGHPILIASNGTLLGIATSFDLL